MKRILTVVFLAAVMAFAVTGCSSIRLVDSDVSAFQKWGAAPPGPNTAYRFERLPSQQAPELQQDAVEAMARSALGKVGMVLDPAAARYSVQVVPKTVVVQRLPFGNLAYDGFGYSNSGVFLAGGSRGASIGLAFPLRFSERYYRREVLILMRDLASQQFVFESRALHDGPWSDSGAVLPAMLDAALRGFPEPPAGRRRIDVEIPR